MESVKESRRFATVLIVCLIVLPASIILVMISRSLAFNGGRGFSISNLLRRAPQGPRIAPNPSPNLKRKSVSETNGLLPPGAEDPSCLSRYKTYRKHSPHKPSPYLITKLRKYEAIHGRCGPRTDSYKRALSSLESDKLDLSNDCKYVVWIPANGLGNRMISMASTFLFAILTERVLLVHQKPDMDGLFCEPFVNSSWILPDNFPLEEHFWDEDHRQEHSIGAMVKSSNKGVRYLFVNVNHGRYQGDNVFYCELGQSAIKNVSWLVMLSDQYYAPSFFTMDHFKEEMEKMFPDKETVFHHLGRYLFHPSNRAWGLIERFYRAYLANADQRIGIQIRVFDPKSIPFDTVMNQILNCSTKERILPELLDEGKPVLSSATSRNATFTSSTKAILAVSLHSEYYEHIKNMYWTKPTVTGEIVGVYQPSHEEFQKFGDSMHNMKAWAEISLLSTVDVMVTSAWSTFGYVAQGLGGIKPWILYKTNDKSVPNPACVRDLSMDPCFHFPPSFDCATNEKVDAGALVPYLRHCEDLNWGVKLVRNEHR
ncbi:Galactoside 2-alpha-L-fucosyltransferase [Linum perenne]